MTRVKEQFKFGICTTATIGSAVVDMVTIPGPAQDATVEAQLIGGTTRSLDGTQRADRFALKRKFTIVPLGFASNVDYWSVLRYWKRFVGPWILFDQTVPNLLTSDQKLLITWTDASGVNAPERLDGAVNVAAGATVQMGPATSPTAVQLVPVTVGQQYSAGVGLCPSSSSSWAATLKLTWYGATFASISSSTVALTPASSPVLSHRYLDGSQTARRYALAATAPAGAVYGQISVANTGTGSIDVLDPALITGPSDPGNAWVLVNIDAMPEIHNKPQTASLTMQMSEV